MTKEAYENRSSVLFVIGNSDSGFSIARHLFSLRTGLLEPFLSDAFKVLLHCDCIVNFTSENKFYSIVSGKISVGSFIDVIK